MPCYDPRDSSPEANRSALLAEFTHNSPVAEMLCAVMKTIHPNDRIELGRRIPNLQAWWDQHQARDAEKNQQGD